MTTALSTQAATAAVLAAGLDTRITSQIALIGHEGYPKPTDAGHNVTGSKAADCRIVYHMNQRARTIQLVIDRDNAPLTGNYVLHIDSTTSTYDATSGAPSDVDELLTDWRDQIATDFPTYTVTVVSASGSGQSDAIRVTAPVGSGYTTFAVAANTAAPELAALELQRELDSSDARIWTKGGTTIVDNSSLTAWELLTINGWALSYDLGTLQSTGYDDRLDIASRTEVYIEIYNKVHTDTVATVGSGVGVYTITDLVISVVAPEKIP